MIERRLPAIPAVLDQHLIGRQVEVIIRMPDGTEYVTVGTFREASMDTDVTEVPMEDGTTHFVLSDQHFHLHLVRKR
jgi:hypothetical protein